MVLCTFAKQDCHFIYFVTTLTRATALNNLRLYCFGLCSCHCGELPVAMLIVACVLSLL